MAFVYTGRHSWVGILEEEKTLRREEEEVVPYRVTV